MHSYNFPPKVRLRHQLFGLFNISNPLKVMHRQFQNLGASYSIQSFLSPYNFIFTKDPYLIDQFLRKHHRKYEKSIFQTEMLHQYVGNGLLTNWGINWKRQRKLIQPGFNHKRIEALHRIMYEEIMVQLENIPVNASQNFYEIFNRLAFKVVAKSLFQSDIDEKDMQRISEVINRSQEMFAKESGNPLAMYWMRWTKQVEKFVNSEVAETREIFKNIIAQRKLKNQPSDDLLDLLLNVKYEDTGEPMEEEQLIDEILILFIAGHETTANALSFTFYLLGKHPEYMQQIKDALQNLEDDPFDVEQLFAPSIIKQILQESLRLYPPAWVIDRQALEEDEYKNFSWPKDTIVVGNIFEMNRDAQMWENPEHFLPERFSNPKTIKEKVYIPFGSGPRYCIGEHFAEMEMQLVLRAFFSRYKFQLLQKDLKLLTYVTLRPEKVIGLKIEK